MRPPNNIATHHLGPVSIINGATAAAALAALAASFVSYMVSYARAAYFDNPNTVHNSLSSLSVAKWMENAILLSARGSD